jgi:hypothetical protein
MQNARPKRSATLASPRRSPREPRGRGVRDARDRRLHGFAIVIYDIASADSAATAHDRDIASADSAAAAHPRAIADVDSSASSGRSCSSRSLRGCYGGWGDRCLCRRLMVIQRSSIRHLLTPRRRALVDRQPWRTRAGRTLGL